MRKLYSSFVHQNFQLISTYQRAQKLATWGWGKVRVKIEKKEKSIEYNGI